LAAIPASLPPVKVLQGGMVLADGTVRARMDAADTPQTGKVSQHEPYVPARLALAGGKLRTSAPAPRPRLSGRLLRCPAGGRDAVAPALPLRGRPPGIGGWKDMLDVIIDHDDVQLPGLLSVMPGQFRVNLPLDPVDCLLLAQKDEMVKLGGMVAISIGRQADGDFG